MTKKEVFFLDPFDCDETVKEALSGSEWEVVSAGDFQEAHRSLESQHFFVGLVIIERCNDKRILGKLEALLSHHTYINWVMILPKECLTEFSDTVSEQQLISNYCYDYHTWPVDPDRLLFILGHAYGMAAMINPPFQEAEFYPGKNGMIGDSAVIHTLFRQIEKVAKEDASVLIEGETGTGKELIANAIHKHSRRSKKPLVAINCGAIPENLIQAELFGYEKGAFTGASQRKIGRIEAADGGTLFLDEIGDLPLEQQVNLLRFLQEKTIERVGGGEKIKLDVRVIAATNVDLRDAVRRGAFREDLYYRLRVLHLESPRLRDHCEDIDLLAWYFYQKYSVEHKHKVKGFSLRALQAMREYDWPGNVRELSNCIRHAVVMSENRLISPEDLGLELRARNHKLLSLEESRAEAEKQAIMSSLRYSNYNVTHTARLLGISRVTLYRLIDKYKLKLQLPMKESEK
ncbi:MAG: sigma 54-interacting transcriptional regulator [Methylohalobius sp. ZOD2]